MFLFTQIVDAMFRRKWCYLLAALSLAPTASNANTHVLQPIKSIDTDCGWIDYVSFSRDGTEIAENCSSSTLKIWGFPAGNLIKTSNTTEPVFLSKDWKYLVTGKGIVETKTERSANVSLRSQWAARAIDRRSHFVAESWVSQDGAEQATRIFDLKSGKQLSAFGTHRARALAFSPDGKILASGHSNLVLLRKWSNGKRVATLRGGGEISSLSFSKNGRLLATGTIMGQVQVWDLPKKKKILSIDIGGIYVSPPAFSPDNRLLAVGIYGTGSIWLIDVAKAKIIDKWHVSDHTCASVDFSPDGRYLIAASATGLFIGDHGWEVGGGIRVFRIHADRL